MNTTWGVPRAHFFMDRIEVIDKRTGERLNIFRDTDFEFGKATKHYRDTFIVQYMAFFGVPNDELTGGKTPSARSKKIFIDAVNLWKETLARYKQVNVPENLVKVLSTSKKKDQVALLKGQVLTPDILMGLLIKAEEMGYTLSQFRSECPQKGLDISKMPYACEIKKDGSLKIYGKTDLTNGQLKQAIEHRKVTVAKILDFGQVWHCLFATYNSIDGKEVWLGKEQAHYHYISSSFGIARTEVIKQIKSVTYKLGNLPHIRFEREA